MVTADTDALSAVVHLLQKVVGELVFGDGSDDPLLACIETILGQQADQLGFCPREEKKSAGAKTGKSDEWGIVLTLFTTKDFWTEAVVWTWCVIPKQKPVLG